jgi:release factor glutamine methyltransferase
MTTAVLPNLDHFRMADAENVYEPAEDTFLLCDALCQEREWLLAMQPTYVLEIGCGSGCVITYATQLFQMGTYPVISMATDINVDALKVTQRTAAANKVSDSRQCCFPKMLSHCYSCCYHSLPLTRFV